MTLTFTAADFTDLGPDLADDAAWLANKFAEHPRHDRRRVMQRLGNGYGPGVRKTAFRAYNAVILAENGPAIEEARKTPPTTRTRPAPTSGELAGVLAGMPGPERAARLRALDGSAIDEIRTVLAGTYGLRSWQQIATGPAVAR